MFNDFILTIITPVYNGEKYISETIESIISAKIEIAYEYLVINDGSTDSTSRLIFYIDTGIGLPYTLTNQNVPITINWSNALTKIMSL